MNETKNVYSIDSATLGQKKVVDADYKINTLYETEVEPIQNALILAWDFKTGTWYDAGQNVDEQLKPVTMMVANLIKENTLLKIRVEKLEAEVFPSEGGKA